MKRAKAKGSEWKNRKRAYKIGAKEETRVFRMPIVELGRGEEGKNFK